MAVLPFLVLLVSLQRILELQIANSNTAHLKRRGAVEFGAAHYPLMVALHTAWLCSTLVEWWWGEPASPSFCSAFKPPPRFAARWVGRCGVP